MDAVMDLTARAVSFITLVQDTFLRASLTYGNKELLQGLDEVYGFDFKEKFSKQIDSVKEYEKNAKQEHAEINRNEKETNPIEEPDELSASLRTVGFESKVIELVWFSTRTVGEKEMKLAEDYLIDLCTNLVGWINVNKPQITKKLDEFGAFSSPYLWRDAISEIIYLNTTQRIALAQALEYVPIHLLLAMGGGRFEAGEQRILQWWHSNQKEVPGFYTTLEVKHRKDFKKEYYEADHKDSDSTIAEDIIDRYYSERIAYFLSHYKELTTALLDKKAPLPFEYIYNRELDEIIKTRELRKKEIFLANDEADKIKIIEEPVETKSNDLNGDQGSLNSCDPFIRGKDMKLFGLAFSGGGIRSATFNLGILQGLAKANVISHVDYLSTVSGGGYIGSWLATWIKRDGSVSKVTDRLNPDKSADPLGEEVRPIRRLRMFSNYFAPNKSIMSVDSWTVGVTWLRNTLLNQIVILSMLLSALLFLKSVFELWVSESIWKSQGEWVYVVVSLLFLIVSLLTGVSMKWYDRGQPGPFTSNLYKNNYVSFWIAAIAVIGSFLISAVFFSYPLPQKEEIAFWKKIPYLWKGGVIIFVILVTIAALGRYDRCIKSFKTTNPNMNPTVYAWLIILWTSFLSAVATVLSLAGAWVLFHLIKRIKFPNDEQFAQEFAFTAGLPIILTVFGITVVSRMALLGKYFPDERREWWGRIGAVVNRFAFLWVLVAASSLLMGDIINTWFTSWSKPASVGGWIALVAGTVNAGFSSKTSGKESAKGFKPAALNILSKAGPYIFALGLLIFLPALMEPLLRTGWPLTVLNAIWEVFTNAQLPEGYEDCLVPLFLAIILFIFAYRFSRRLGVNEFSMHHFYRNRLVRAYLGATRRKSSKEKTTNPFTGFDKYDDEKLSQFTHDHGYYGPYPILNTTLNASQVSDLSRQDRKGESFIFSPLFCGFDFSKIRSSVNTIDKSYDYGYRQTIEYAYPNDKGPGIGTAMAISGAAVNANQGYHSSAGTAFLLTVFNVQMGWWIGNPRKRKWQQADPDYGLTYVFRNLTGSTNTRNMFLCLSDGGHFDNMGLYELVRRKCTFIILGDGEQDTQFSCEGLANAIRKCRIDFGAEISIDLKEITNRENGFSKKHYVLGKIKYSGDKEAKGTLLYIKSSVTGDESVDVHEYSLNNPSFPQQTTADQFFDEEQFESYRKLGMHISNRAMADKKVIDELELQSIVKPGQQNMIQVIEKPVKKLYNMLKDFFTKKE